MSRRDDITPDDLWFKDEDKVLPFTIYQADGTTRQDITGWSLEWTVRDGASYPSPLILKTTGGAGITLTTPLQGEGEIAIADTDTASMSPGKYWHRLKRTTAGSEQVEVHGEAYLLAGG